MYSQINFKGAIFHSYVKLPEGKHPPTEWVETHPG